MPNPDQDISGFAAKIKKYLISVDLTLESLAEDLAIHPTTLGYWIHGDYRKLKRGEKISLSPEKVKQVIAALARKEAIVTVAEALELLTLALPDRPRLQKFNKADQKTDWFRELCANELDGATPYTAHRLPLRTEPKNGNSKVTEDANISSNANLAPLPPRSANGLVGREAEIEQLIEMLTYPDSNVRLVTLKGMGGIGKTSLGVEVLHRLTGHDSVSQAFLDGITFVPLAEATSTGLLIAAMLQAVGAKPAASGSEVSPAEQLTNFLANKRMLIMLDNFEQLLGVNTGSGELEENPRLFLSNLLTAAPEVELVVTSQARLRIQGEQIFEVGFLGYPTLGTAVNLDTVIQEYPAVKLFVEAANRENNNLVNDAFTLTAENVQDVCAICYYLDGIPLAISLAAGRANEFKPDVMLAAFLARGAAIGDANFTSKRHSSMVLLAQGAGYLPKRHQKIESTLDWSYGWLTDKERAVFRRLAVFEGGFGLEAVASVCTGVVGKWEVGEIISSLVGKSLVVSVSSGSEIRYKLLVTMQDYGLLQLEKAGELAGVMEQHAGWGLGLAREAEPHLTGNSANIWQARLEIDYLNLIAALSFFLKEQKASEAAELAGIMGYLWAKFGAKNTYFKEGREWLRRVVELAEGKSTVPPVFMARALHQAGRLAYQEKDYEVSKLLLNRAVLLWRKAKDTRGLALSSISLGNIAYSQSEYPIAETLYTHAETLARKIKDKYSLSLCLQNIGNIQFMLANLEVARAKYEVALELRRELNDRATIAILLKNLATIAVKKQSLKEAEQFSRESLELYEQLGNKNGKIENFFNLAKVYYYKNNIERAMSYYKAGFALSVELTNFYYVPFAVIHLAYLLVTSYQDYLVAAKLYGAVEAWVKTSKTQIDSHDQSIYNAGVAIMKEHLDKTILEVNWQEGTNLGADLRKLTSHALAVTD